MYKDKTKQKEAAKERKRRQRAKGVTSVEGVTAMEAKGVTYPHIIDKLTDPAWRAHLEKVCEGFARREDLKACTYLGGVPLTIVCDWLECTS